MQTVLCLILSLQALKQYIICPKQTPIAQVMPLRRCPTHPTQPSYINPPHLEKNSSLSLACRMPYHLDDIQTDQPH